MATYAVQFAVHISGTATEAEIIEWLRFSLHDKCDISISNPLSPYEPEPVPGTFRAQEVRP